MKVLLCHTYYMQRGGEDDCYEEERDLLRAKGHQVVEYVRRNEELTRLNSLAAAAVTLWNRRAARDICNLIIDEQPAVVHCTNTFPLISPAACHAAHRAGVPVVQALHNYRWLCAGAYFMRDGRPCEDCLTSRLPWPAIRHRCYRGSASASAVVAGMQVLHGLRRTIDKIDAFFTPTEFAKQRFVNGGFPPNRVHVKSNSVQPDPAEGRGEGGYLAFIGRLCIEKGITTLLDAWRRHASLPPLVIAGDGPLAADVVSAAASDPRIKWHGQLPTAEIHRIVGAASALVMPSLWYETFGRTIVEAFATGTVVVASRLGAMAELVDENRTGWLFEPGNSDDLAAKVHRLHAAPPHEIAAMRRSARQEYELRFTPERNYARLIEIYDMAQREAEIRRERRAAARTGTVEGGKHPIALATKTSGSGVSFEPTQRRGEDRFFEEERDLSAAHDHHVVEYVRTNSELTGLG